MYIKGATMRTVQFKPDSASSYYDITVLVANGKAIGPRVCCLLALHCALFVCSLQTSFTYLWCSFQSCCLRRRRLFDEKFEYM